MSRAGVGALERAGPATRPEHRERVPRLLRRRGDASGGPPFGPWGRNRGPGPGRSSDRPPETRLFSARRGSCRPGFIDHRTGGGAATASRADEALADVAGRTGRRRHREPRAHTPRDAAAAKGARAHVPGAGSLERKSALGLHLVRNRGAFGTRDRGAQGGQRVDGLGLASSSSRSISDPAREVGR